MMYRAQVGELVAARLDEATHTSEPLPGDPVADAAALLPAPQLRDPFRYVILGEHGRGGVGCVYRAHDRELGRDVAIKELLVRGGVNEVRFLREALITARLDHPGVVPVYEAGRWPDGTPFYTMKLLSGRSLRTLIAERTSVDARLDQRLGLLDHLIAVADTIAYAHSRNIIHRDLKPANIIVDDFGQAVVIDWGLAKDLSAVDDLPSVTGSPPPSHTELTATGSILGTPTYMAPEQERGGRVDKRADVFAIGAMLWELCAPATQPRTLPAEAHTRDRMLRGAGISSDLIAIINKALAAAPDHRYPDAAALAADLKAIRAATRSAQLRHHARSASQRTAPGKRYLRPTRRRFPGKNCQRPSSTKQAMT